MEIPQTASYCVVDETLRANKHRQDKMANEALNLGLDSASVISATETVSLADIQIDVGTPPSVRG